MCSANYGYFESTNKNDTKWTYTPLGLQKANIVLYNSGNIQQQQYTAQSQQQPFLQQQQFPSQQPNFQQQQYPPNTPLPYPPAPPNYHQQQYSSSTAFSYPPAQLGQSTLSNYQQAPSKYQSQAGYPSGGYPPQPFQHPPPHNDEEWDSRTQHTSNSSLGLLCHCHPAATITNTFSLSLFPH